MYKEFLLPPQVSYRKVSERDPLVYKEFLLPPQVSYRKVSERDPLVYKNVTRVGTDLYGLEHDTVYLVGTFIQ